MNRPNGIGFQRFAIHQNESYALQRIRELVRKPESERLEDYLNVFYVLTGRLPNISDYWLKNKFMKGLPPSYRSDLISFHSPSWLVSVCTPLVEEYACADLYIILLFLGYTTYINHMTIIGKPTCNTTFTQGTMIAQSSDEG
jgi:hypothetical protein